MHNAVDFDRPAADDVEDKVGFHDEYSVAVHPEFGIPGDTSQMRLLFQTSNPLVQAVEKCHSSGGTVAGNPLKNRKQVFLGGWKIPKRQKDFTGHGACGGVGSSSACA
jgi:hypothetical protein